jgi:dihydroorotate dehydrogenase
MAQTSTLYDLNQSFEENVTYGPFFSGEFPQLPQVKSNDQKSFMGHKVNSLFGVAASPMTMTARSIEVCAKLGYDIMTYRSVRSVEWRGLKSPNLCYVNVPQQLTKADLVNSVVGSSKPFAGQEVTAANSYGIQSFKPKYWQAEYEEAKRRLLPGQLLILALMITPEDGHRDAVADATEVARLASQTSAEIFEINLACPNSGSSALIYEDIELSAQVCAAVKKQIGGKPLLVKVGYYSDFAQMKLFLEKTKGIIAGMTSTNTCGMKVINEAGQEYFPGRPFAGVSGDAIRNLVTEQAQELIRLRAEMKLNDFTIVAIGGVTQPKHIQQYLDLGADAVQAVAGVWADPYLAAKWKGVK